MVDGKDDVKRHQTASRISASELLQNRTRFLTIGYIGEVC